MNYRDTLKAKLYTSMTLLVLLSFTPSLSQAVPRYYVFEGTIIGFQSYHSELDISDFDIVLGETTVEYVFLVDFESNNSTSSNSAGTWHRFYSTTISGSIINGRTLSWGYTGFNWYRTSGSNIGMLQGPKNDIRIMTSARSGTNWRVQDWKIGQRFRSTDLGSFSGSSSGSAVYAYGDVVLTEISSPNKAPFADAGEDRTFSAYHNCTAWVQLDATGSSDPDGDPLVYIWKWAGGSATGATLLVNFPLGIHDITLYVSDGIEEASDTVTMTVADTISPSLSISATPAVLWPPTHKMETIDLSIIAVDNCDRSPAVTLDSITMNEGDIDDYRVINPSTVLLRSERNGKGQDRIYTLHYSATDQAGNVTDLNIDITVPHDGSLKK